MDWILRLSLRSAYGVHIFLENTKFQECVWSAWILVCKWSPGSAFRVRTFQQKKMWECVGVRRSALKDSQVRLECALLTHCYALQTHFSTAREAHKHQKNNDNEMYTSWMPLLLHPWWRHQMETFSALLAICAGNSPVPGEFPAQWPVTRALMFSLICAWINGWVNNREAGDLRRHRAHYDVIVMHLLDGPLLPTDINRSSIWITTWTTNYKIIKR